MWKLRKSTIILLIGTLLAIISFSLSVYTQTGKLFQNLYNTWLIALSITDIPRIISYSIFLASLVIITILVFLPWYWNQKSEERSYKSFRTLEKDIKETRERVESLYREVREIEKMMKKEG